MALFVSAAADSRSFGACIREHKEYQPYHQLYEDDGFVVITIARMRLSVARGFVAAGENEGAFTAVDGRIVYRNAGGMAAQFETQFLWSFDGEVNTFQMSEAGSQNRNRWT